MTPGRAENQRLMFLHSFLLTKNTNYQKGVGLMQIRLYLPLRTKTTSMRKAIFTLVLAAVYNLGFASGNAEVFSVDEQEMNAEFAQLNELEQ